MGELIKILDFVDGKSTVLTDQIPDGDEDQAGKPLSIITSIGSFGTGKSFLQNILHGAIQKGESFFEDDTELLEVFPLETSIESETKGIDMFNKYLKNPYDDKDMLLSLWDAEGPSNPHQFHDQGITVFALSAVFSQVLIYNVKEKLTLENMDKIQIFMEQMQGQLSGNKVKFQTLIIVVRDADDEFGYNWEGGKAYKEYMKTKGGRQQGQTTNFLKEIEEAFSSVLVFMMPLPNHAVRSKRIKLTHAKDIGDELFRKSLQSFTKRLLHQIVKPEMVNRQVFHVSDLKHQLRVIAEQLIGEKKAMFSTLANLMKQKILEKELKLCAQKYQLELEKVWGQFQMKATRIQHHEDLKNKILEKFRTTLDAHYVDAQMANASFNCLEKLLDDTFEAHNQGFLGCALF